MANVITIIAGRRAFWAYCRSLGGVRAVWEKTEHHEHPALLAGKAGPVGKLGQPDWAVA